MPKRRSSTPINHHNNKYTTKLCKKLLTFSENGKFSDICIISSDGIKFNSHKCVLSAASDYFMAMFGGSLKESSSTKVQIHEINGKVLQLVLTFLYTGQIQLQSDTIKEILRAAKFFQIQPLIAMCYYSMAENLDAKNCLEIALFADQHELLKLHKIAFEFASANFEKICKETHFLQLDEHQLGEIMSRQELWVSSEEVVYLNLIKWMEHDRLNREQSAIKLLSKIRYWLLSPSFIKEHRSKLPKQIECFDMVCTWLEWHLLPESQRRTPMAFSKPTKSSLLFVGDGKIQTYDGKLNIWTIESFPNLPTSFMNVVAVKNKLIFGAVGKPILCFDLQTHEVTNLPSRNVQSEYNGMVVLYDELYVFSKDSRLVEKFNFSTNKWQNVTPMNTVFVNPKAAAVNGNLYVMSSETYMMDIFNHNTNNWISRHSNNTLEMAFGLTEFNGQLYKFGGIKIITTNIRQICNNVQIYENDSYSWKDSYDPMKFALADMHCTSWNKQLIICGGVDHTSTYLNLVQANRNNEWITLSPLIEYKPKTSYGLVTIY